MTGVQLQLLVDALRDVVLGQQVIHGDQTPVQMLMPGTKKTHRSYVWAYATSQFSDVAAVVYDFSPSRAGEHARIPRKQGFTLEFVRYGDDLQNR